MSTTSGWGRFTWGQANWNADTTLKTGWGAQQWSGDGGWGDLSDQTVSVSLTGIQITSSIGSVDVPDVVLTPTGLQSTFSQGEAFVPVVIDDTLSIKYITIHRYLNRGCGFISNFIIDKSSENLNNIEGWIKEVSIAKDSIFNEEKTNLYIHF